MIYFPVYYISIFMFVFKITTITEVIVMFATKTRAVVKNIDLYFGLATNILFPAYIEEKFLKSGSGTYLREEWILARANNYCNAGLNLSKIQNDNSYIKRALGEEYRKLISGIRFCRKFDLSKVKTILEIGCGEMITSLAIKMANPHLRYIASDFDPSIIEACSRLSILNGIEKVVLDINELDIDYLFNVDLIVAWEVLYAFNPSELNKLIYKCATSKTRLVIASAQFIGPINWLLFHLKNAYRKLFGLSYSELASRHIIREHGTKYSLGYINRLAKQHGMAFKIKCFSNCDVDTGDAYSFIELLFV